MPRSIRRQKPADQAHSSYVGLVTNVVRGLMPQGGFAITQLTGLSSQDLVQTGVALAESLVDDWDEERGSSLSNWIAGRVHNRLVDIIRSASKISRAKFQILRLFWAKQEELGLRSENVEEIIDALLLDNEKLTREKIIDALDAHRFATSACISESEMKSSDGKTPEVGMRVYTPPPPDRAVCNEQRRRIIVGLMESIDSPYGYMTEAVFLYLVVGLSMKEVGNLYQLSESRISQQMSLVLPFALQRAYGFKLEGLSGDEFGVRLDRAARQKIKAIRDELRSCWAFLDKEEQDNLRKELFPKE